jgi:asparagine synthase (glutamine-hydrolysing)
LEPLARSILSPDSLRRQGFFRPEPVNAMLDAHVAGKQDLNRQLWNLLVFSLWHDRYVNSAGPV